MFSILVLPACNHASFKVVDCDLGFLWWPLLEFQMSACNEECGEQQEDIIHSQLHRDISKHERPDSPHHMVDHQL
jgi:hypothetical protein